MIKGLVQRTYATISKRKKFVNFLDRKVEQYTPPTIQKLWHHEAGLKTIFFWGPLAKWGLILAGISDVLTREDEDISVAPAASLFVSGVIWSRWALIIYPKNYMLFSVNCFLALTQSIMVFRGLRYMYTVEPGSEKPRDVAQTEREYPIYEEQDLFIFIMNFLKNRKQ